jgi:glutathione S-transferase
MRVIEAHQLTIPTADTREDPEARATLYAQTGRTQVPCLMIDGVAFFESADINQWLEAYVIRGGAL